MLSTLTLSANVATIAYIIQVWNLGIIFSTFSLLYNFAAYLAMSIQSQYCIKSEKFMSQQITEVLVKLLIVSIYTQKYNIFSVVKLLFPTEFLISNGPLNGELVTLFYLDGIMMRPLYATNSGVPGVGKQKSSSGLHLRM